MKNNENKRLTLDEVSEMLLQKDTRAVKSYVEKGWIPKIAYNKDDMTIDAVLLAGQMGVDNFDEPFISEQQAAKILGFDATKKLIYFCQKKGINAYRLSNQIGVKYLFRESDLQKCLDIKLEILPFAIEDLVRKNTLATISETLKVLAVLVDSGKGLSIIKKHLEGMSLEEIGNYEKLGRERVRQILAITTKRINYRAEAVKIWINVFSKTEYAKMHPRNILNLIDELQAENRNYKEQLSKILNGKDPKEVLAENSKSKDIEKEKLLLKSIDELDFSVRAYNCLSPTGIKTVGDLVKHSVSDFLKFGNMSEKTINEIKEVLKEKGLELIKD